MNFERLLAGKPILFHGEEVEIPNTDFLFFGGKTDEKITDQMQPLFEKATGEKDGELKAFKMAGQYFVVMLVTRSGRMTFFFGFNESVMAWMRAGGSQDFRCRPSDEKGKPTGGGGLIVTPFFTESPDKLKQQMLAAGLIGPGTRLKDTSRQKPEPDYTEQIRQWKESLNSMN